MIQCRFELIVDCGIWAHLRSRVECRVVLKELRLQNSQSRELREEIARRLAYGPNRIVRMLRLPRRKIPLRAGEIHIVESEKSTIEGRVRDRVGRLRASRHCAQPTTQPQGCYHTEDQDSSKSVGKWHAWVKSVYYRPFPILRKITFCAFV